MKKFYFALLCVLVHASVLSQCLSEGDIGDFEATDPLASDWWNATQDKGMFSISSSEVNSGSQALKVDVTSPSSWEIRTLTNSCNISLTQDKFYDITFFAKGDLNANVTVTLMGGWGNDLSSSSINLTSTDWTEYTVSLQADADYTTGKVRFNFTDVGTYFLDDVSMLEGEDFLLQDIDLTDDRIYFEGANEKEFTNTGAIRTWRFLKTYATHSNGTYNTARASSSAGVLMKIKTSSPHLEVTFEEDLTWADDFHWEIPVFQNGILHSSSGNLSVPLSNSTGQSVEWSFLLPVYNQINVAGIKLESGYALESIEETKPVYVAIGNSITMGVGVTANNSANSYARIVADDQGYELYNWAIGGSTTSSAVFDNFSTGISPSLVSILWGYNDVHYGSSFRWANEVFPAYEALLDSICRSFPSSKVLAILPIYSFNESGKNGTISELRANQLAIIQTLQNTYDNLCFIYGDDFVDSDPLLKDGVHPNDAGNAALAQGVLDNLGACNYTDCAGVLNGSAFLDNCDLCVGGNTGKTACVTDCHGDEGGTAFLDDCNVCVGGNTGISPCDASRPLAECKGKWLGNIFREAYWSLPWSPRDDFKNYWNQVTPGNAGKWGALEPSRDNFRWESLDTMNNFCARNGFLFKQHVFVWGTQQPNWIGALSEAEQREEFEEYIAAFAERYPDIPIIEVANESLDGHAPLVEFRDALGGLTNGASNPYLSAHPEYGPYGTGWDYIIYAAAKAREYFPNATLLINDYGIIGNTSNLAEHMAIAQILQDRGLIDAIGFQGHQFTVDNMTATQMETNLNTMASLGLPIHVTELDISGMINSDFSDKALADATQLQRYQTLFPIMWEHPSVAGITIWNYVEGDTWRDNNIWLLEADGTERPAMVWLKEYMASQPDVCGQECTPPDLGENQVLCEGELLTLTSGLGTTNREFTWYQDGVMISNAHAENLAITEVGDYLVKVDEEGCINYDDVSVTQATLAECVINAVEHNEKNAFTVYPNPVTSTLRVVCQDQLKATLLDFTGRMVREFEVMPGESTIEVGDLSSGLYFLHAGERVVHVIKR